MRKKDTIRREPAKILLGTGLVGVILAIIFWLYFLSKEQSISKQFPALEKIENLQRKIAHIDEEMDSVITFRQAIHFRPEKFIHRCAYLEETYRNYENQYRDLTSQPAIAEPVRRKKRFELYANIACLSFFGFLLLVRIGADQLCPPLAHGDNACWLASNSKKNSSDIMGDLYLTQPIQLRNRI